MAHISKPATESRGAVGAAYAIGAAFFNRPIMMTETHAAWIRDSVQSGHFDTAMASETYFDGKAYDKDDLRISKDGIVTLPIHGSLLDRAARPSLFNALMGEACSYEVIAQKANKLSSDDRVKAIILDINSPGGMVAGVWEAADALARLGKKKPLYAIAQNMMCSAAYALGCVAKKIYATQSADVGSIGVIRMHVSEARAIAQQGIDVTIFSSGEAKSLGSPLRPLNTGDSAELASDVEESYATFCSHVAKHRRGMTADDAKGTNARVVSGERAVEMKLVDKVGSFDDLLKSVRRDIGSADGGTAKAQPKTPQPADKVKDRKKMDIEQVDAPSMAASKAQAAERDRIKDIMTSSYAERAPKTAQLLAFDLGMTADHAGKVLSAVLEDLEGVAMAAPEAEKALADHAPAPIAAPAPSPTATLESALHAEMAKAGNSAAVAPEAGEVAPDALQARAAAFAERRQAQRKRFGFK